MSSKFGRRWTLLIFILFFSLGAVSWFHFRRDHVQSILIHLCHRFSKQWLVMVVVSATSMQVVSCLVSVSAPYLPFHPLSYRSVRPRTFVAESPVSSRSWWLLVSCCPTSSTVSSLFMLDIQTSFYLAPPLLLHLPRDLTFAFTFSSCAWVLHRRSPTFAFVPAPWAPIFRWTCSIMSSCSERRPRWPQGLYSRRRAR